MQSLLKHTFATAGNLSVMFGGVVLSEAEQRKGYQICKVIKEDREEKDFVWRMTMGKPSKFHDHWHGMMARCLLRTVRSIPHARQNTSVQELTQLLFGISEVGDIRVISEVPYNSIEEQVMMVSSVSGIASALINFVNINNDRSMPGSDEETVAARKEVAKAALFFTCMHYDLAFLHFILDPRNKLPFMNRKGVLNFVIAPLCTQLDSLINGNLTQIPFFNATCVSEYGMNVNLDPYINVPLELKPPEDPRVLTQSRKDEIKRRGQLTTPGSIRITMGDEMIVGYDERRD